MIYILHQDFGERIEIKGKTFSEINKLAKAEAEKRGWTCHVLSLKNKKRDPKHLSKLFGV